MNKLKNKKLLSLALAGALTATLSSCAPTELGSDKSGIDIIDTTIQDGGYLAQGINQVLNVEGETFKLSIDYICEEGNDWRITDTKHLYMSIKTQDLDDSKEVFIDNIHTDTSIVSTKAIFDGIIQDSMDDRIHNSLMLGFPISNSNSYYGCNVIEGQNSEFIEGWTYGYNGYGSGSISSKRHLESDFLEKGVYANQIDSVIDLIVVDKETGEQRAVSVFSNLLIRVNDKITFIENGEEVTYKYDKEGNKVKIEEDNSLKLEK